MGAARHRGRPKPWALAQAVKKRIVELARTKYAGFNDSHRTEKLIEVEEITVSRETVRRLLRKAGLSSPHQRRAKKYRARRERKVRVGMMVLTDASREDWLEGRGPALKLIGYQDDATGKMLACGFQLEPENTVGYLRQLRAMVERHGAPLSLYRDQHGTFQRNERTFQDRLRSELRLSGAATLEQANVVLERFRQDYNRRFGVPARERPAIFGR